MAVYTNPLGLLHVEVDSAGSLRLAGDRVIFGAKRSSQAEREWLIRQRVAHCLDTVADAVHRRRGIVSAGVGDRLLCHLPDAASALAAAGAVLREQTAPAGDPESTQMSVPLGIRIALHFGPLLVDAGRVTGEGLDIVGTLLERAVPGQILVSQGFVDALGEAGDGRITALGESAAAGSSPPLALYEVEWRMPDVDLGRPESGAAPEPVPGAGVSPPPDHAAGRRDGVSDRPPPHTPPADAPATYASAGPGPRLTLRFRGQARVVDREQPELLLRGGKERREHAKVRLDGNRFILESLTPAGIRLRRAEGREELCRERTELTDRGEISLGDDFGPGSQVVQYEVG